MRGFSLRGNLHATDENTSPRQKFFHWLESQVTAQRFKADPSVVVAVANTLKKVFKELVTRHYDDQEQDMASRLLLQRYFLELPEQIRHALQLDPEVMARLGVTLFDSVMIGSLRFERTEFYEAVVHALHDQEGRVTERTLRTEYILSATSDSKTGQRIIEIKDQRGVVIEKSRDVLMEFLLDDPRARQEGLRLHRSWFDCSIDEFEKTVAEIASTEKPRERVEKARGWWETSAAVFYSRIEQQLQEAGRFSRDDLLPPSATGLLRHFRLDSLVDDANFQDHLQKAATTLVEEEGLESAISRLGCLPVKLPAVFAEACDRLTNSERQQFFETLAIRWASPVCKLHLLDLVLRYARDNPFYLDLARSVLRELFDETNGALHHRLFAALLNFVSDEFGYWAETASWPASVKLAMIWAHASRLHNIFMAAHIPSDQLVQEFEQAQHHIIPIEILGREPAFWDDVLHPRRINRIVFLVHGVSAILAGSDPEIIGQLGIRDVLLNTGFPEANGNRSPHIGLLHDPGLARNVLGSFFGGNRTAVLERCLGSEPANTLASSSLYDIVQQAIQSLRIDPCQQSEWAKIGMIVGDLPMHDDLRPEFRDLLASLDFGALNAVDPTTASLALHVVADQIVHFVEEELRSRCQTELLASTRFQARRNSRSTNDVTTAESKSAIPSFLLDVALNLSRKPGDLRGTSETFAKLMQELFNTWPQLAQMFRPGLYRLVKELPACQLHGLWRLVLLSRACGD